MPSPATTQVSPDELKAHFSALGLHADDGTLEDFIARAIKGRWPPRTVLVELVREQTRYREQRSLKRRLDAAKLGRYKQIADFDWNWPTKIDRAAVERALSGSLIQQRENLLLIAAQGLGKTMITKNIAYQAVMKGHSALYVEASRMLLDLGSRETARALDKRLRHYARPDILCIDEVGYLSYDARAADLLFEVVTRRYENKSLVITTNLPFSDWPTMFPNATCVTALVDRLTHHAEIVAIEGESYRRREAEQTRNRRRKGAAE